MTVSPSATAAARTPDVPAGAGQAAVVAGPEELAEVRGGQAPAGRRRGCHCADAPSASLLKGLLEVEESGGVQQKGSLAGGWCHPASDSSVSSAALA